MANTISLVINNYLIHEFIKYIDMVLKERGFKEILSIKKPDFVDVFEYMRDDNILSITVSDAEENMSKIEISTNKKLPRELLFNVTGNLTFDIALTFLQSIIDKERLEELKAKRKEYIKKFIELFKEFLD